MNSPTVFAVWMTSLVIIKYKNKLTAILRYSAKQHYSNILELNKMNMKETWKILNTVINKKEKGLQYPTQFNDDDRKVTSNIDIANGFNRFFSNIGLALARNIPNGTTNFTNYLNQKVEESIFLNPVTDEEIIEIVKDAKTKYSKDHDSIDMSLVKLVIPYIVNIYPLTVTRTNRFKNSLIRWGLYHWQ